MKPLNQHIDNLIRKHCQGTLSEAEARELENWKEFSDANRQVFKERVLLHSSDEETLGLAIARPAFSFKRILIFLSIIAVAILFLSLFAGQMRQGQKNTAGPTLTDTFPRIQLPPGITFGKDSIISINKVTVEDLMKLTTYLYHVPVIYRDRVSTKKLSGTISHTATIATILKMLEFNGIKATYDGKKIIVGQ